MAVTQQEREVALILNLCRERGPECARDPSTGTLRTTADWTDTDLIAGFRANHPPDDIAAAAVGDVAALLKLRQACDLPIFA